MRRLSTSSAHRRASFDNSESYVSRRIDDQTIIDAKRRDFFSPKNLVFVIATKENAARMSGVHKP
jgi:hypothetical protein